jgi:hypothetical protein
LPEKRKLKVLIRQSSKPMKDQKGSPLWHRGQMRGIWLASGFSLVEHPTEDVRRRGLLKDLYQRSQELLAAHK